MAIERCQLSGKSGFRSGPNGKCYTYNTGDKTSRDRARKNAERQERAMQRNARKDNR